MKDRRGLFSVCISPFYCRSYIVHLCHILRGSRRDAGGLKSLYSEVNEAWQRVFSSKKEACFMFHLYRVLRGVCETARLYLEVPMEKRRRQAWQHRKGCCQLREPRTDSHLQCQCQASPTTQTHSTITLHACDIA
jgi:hypothetical protein